MSKVIIETDRLILRRFELSDAKEVFEFGSNLEVSKYTGEPPLESIDQAKGIISSVNFSDYEKYGYGRWAVVYKPNNKVIGFAGLKYLPEVKKTDIGYRFSPEYWGIGIASEASFELIQYGFEQLSLNEIIGIADPRNIASWKVLEKIGMQFYKKDHYDNSVEIYNWYRIEKKEWLKL